MSCLSARNRCLSARNRCSSARNRWGWRWKQTLLDRDSAALRWRRCYSSDNSQLRCVVTISPMHVHVVLCELNLNAVKYIVVYETMNGFLKELCITRHSRRSCYYNLENWNQNSVCIVLFLVSDFIVYNTVQNMIWTLPQHCIKPFNPHRI